MGEPGTGWQSPPPPPARPHPGGSRVGAVVVLAIGAIVLLLGIARVVTADSAYLAGRAMGQCTIGGVGVVLGIVLLNKSRRKQ